MYASAELTGLSEDTSRPVGYNKRQQILRYRFPMSQQEPVTITDVDP